LVLPVLIILFALTVGEKDIALRELPGLRFAHNARELKFFNLKCALSALTQRSRVLMEIVVYLAIRYMDLEASFYLLEFVDVLKVRVLQVLIILSVPIVGELARQ